jgi:hypothetical protein
VKVQSRVEAIQEVRLVSFLLHRVIGDLVYVKTSIHSVFVFVDQDKSSLRVFLLVRFL